MAKIYSLLIFIHSRKEPFHFTVGKGDYDRLSRILDSAEIPMDQGCFWCNTTDGRSVIINVSAVQAVRFLWDAWPAQRVLETPDELIQIYLRGREKSIDTSTDSASSIYDFFSHLELDPKLFPFPSFEDIAGEYLYVNASEVDLVIAPKELMDEGARIALEELEDDTAGRESG
jgi:hypothetical protein